jgi:hypothetical protein
MNIINNLKSLLINSGYINDDIAIDYTENTTGKFGLFNSGESLQRNFIDGGKEYLGQFILYFFDNSYDDLSRVQNLQLIKNICDYLEGIRDVIIEDSNNVNIGYIKNITTNNGALYNIPGSPNDGYAYQIQIDIIYYIKP